MKKIFNVIAGLLLCPAFVKMQACNPEIGPDSSVVQDGQISADSSVAQDGQISADSSLGRMINSSIEVSTIELSQQKQAAISSMRVLLALPSNTKIYLFDGLNTTIERTSPHFAHLVLENVLDSKNEDLDNGQNIDQTFKDKNVPVREVIDKIFQYTDVQFREVIDQIFEETNVQYQQDCKTIQSDDLNNLKNLITNTLVSLRHHPIGKKTLISFLSRLLKDHDDNQKPLTINSITEDYEQAPDFPPLVFFKQNPIFYRPTMNMICYAGSFFDYYQLQGLKEQGLKFCTLKKGSQENHDWSEEPQSPLSAFSHEYHHYSDPLLLPKPILYPDSDDETISRCARLFYVALDKDAYDKQGSVKVDDTLLNLAEDFCGCGQSESNSTSNLDQFSRQIHNGFTFYHISFTNTLEVWAQMGFRVYYHNDTQSYYLFLNGCCDALQSIAEGSPVYIFHTSFSDNDIKWLDIDINPYYFKNLCTIFDVDYTGYPKH